MHLRYRCETRIRADFTLSLHSGFTLYINIAGEQQSLFEYPNCLGGQRASISDDAALRRHSYTTLLDLVTPSAHEKIAPRDLRTPALYAAHAQRSALALCGLSDNFHNLQWHQ